LSRQLSKLPDLRDYLYPVFLSDEVLERIAHALKIDPTELFSKTCYPVEAVRSLHQSVLEGFDQVVKAQITKFEAKYRG
jgi:hypothetical protein